MLTFQGSTLTLISTCPSDKLPPNVTCPNAYFTIPTLNQCIQGYIAEEVAFKTEKN